MKSTEFAFFDFDGTLSEGDSGWRFVVFCLGWFGFLKSGFFALIETLFQRLTTQSSRPFHAVLKENSLKQAFGGRSEDWLRFKAEEFASQVLPQLERPEVHKILKKHKEDKVRCVLVSASPDIYLFPWAEEHGFETVLATRLKMKDGIFTGKFEGENCKKQEKVNRIKAYLKKEKLALKTTLSKSHAYGNSSGDFEMLRAVKHGWMVERDQLSRFE